MNWEQTQIYNGARFIVSYAYLNDLWRFAASVSPERGDGLRQSAAMMFLYSLDLVALDGVKCEDVSTPAPPPRSAIRSNGPILAYMRSLPRAKRMMLGTISLDVEAATAPFRKTDEVLCSGGLTQMSQGLQAQGTKPLQQVPNAPGTYGRSMPCPRLQDIGLDS